VSSPKPKAFCVYSEDVEIGLEITAVRYVLADDQGGRPMRVGTEFCHVVPIRIPGSRRLACSLMSTEVMQVADRMWLMAALQGRREGSLRERAAIDLDSRVPMPGDLLAPFRAAPAGAQNRQPLTAPRQADSVGPAAPQKAISQIPPITGGAPIRSVR
jgi:hypothetical protein